MPRSARPALIAVAGLLFSAVQAAGPRTLLAFQAAPQDAASITAPEAPPGATASEGVMPAGSPAREAAAYPYEGEVAGENVYVRSGPGTNWYPTTKLNTGARVRVIGEEGDWLKIVPPDGSFSYVEASLVERSADGGRGTTKVDGAYVKAGSELSPRKIASQQVLPRGAEVTILGESEGFYRIVPPEGCYLYISKAYVRPATGPRPAGEARSRATPPDALLRAEQAARESATGRAGAARNPSTEGPADAPVSAPPRTSQYRAMLDAAEAELRGLLASRSSLADCEPLLERYRSLAAQEEDAVARAVARARVEQLSARIELERIVRDALIKKESVSAFSEKMEEERLRILNSKLPPELRAWDYRGELRRSMAFSGQPNRYRLFDPLRQATLAYIDIPPATGLDPQRFVDRYVGIRVSGQFFSPSARVPIGVASEIEILPRPGLPEEPPAADQAPAAAGLPRDDAAPGPTGESPRAPASPGDEGGVAQEPPEESSDPVP